MFDCQLWGLWPGGHLLTNVILHAAVTISLFLMLRSLTGALWRSTFVAAVFAIHPLRAESVAWVSARADLLSALFFVLSVWSYSLYARGEEHSVRHYTIAFGLFACGLMCKSTIIAMPFVLLLLDYWPLQRFARSDNRSSNFLLFGRLALEKTPFVALSFASAWLTVLAQHNAIDAVEPHPLSYRLGSALISYVVYLKQLIYPVRLAAFYPHSSNDISPAHLILAVLLLALISTVAFLWRKQQPFLLVGWLWYIGILIPVIGVVQFGLQVRADRYTYLSQIGVLILLTWSATHLLQSWRYSRAAFSWAGILSVLVLLNSTRTQVSYWRDSEALWRHAIACTSGNYLAYTNLGAALVQKGQVNEALTLYTAALAIKPSFPQTHNSIGLAYLQNGQTNDAIGHFLRAIELRPAYAEAESNLGIALLQQHRTDEAVAHFEKAVVINPTLFRAYDNLGATLMEKGRVDEAISHFKKALQIEPQYEETHINLGNAWLKEGKQDEAAVEFETARQIHSVVTRAENGGGGFSVQKHGNATLRQYFDAIKADPNDAWAHVNIANALRTAGQTADAVDHYEKAIAINPEFAQAHNGLGNALLQRGKMDEAIAHYETAIRIQPRLAEAHNNLATALLQTGREKEAIEHARKALEFQPHNVSFENNLALMLAATPDDSLRDGSAALELAEQANQLSGQLQPDVLATLAAAYAETGRFAEAVQTAQKAAALAATQHNMPLHDRVELDLKLYQANKPLRLPMLSGTAAFRQ